MRRSAEFGSKLKKKCNVHAQSGIAVHLVVDTACDNLVGGTHTPWYVSLRPLERFPEGPLSPKAPACNGPENY